MRGHTDIEVSQSFAYQMSRNIIQRVTRFFIFYFFNFLNKHVGASRHTLAAFRWESAKIHRDVLVDSRRCTPYLFELFF